MSLIPRRDNRVSATRAALSVAGATSIANLLRHGYAYLQEHGQPFPTQEEMRSNYGKRRMSGGGTPLKRRRQVATYIPRGRFMNYRTGGYEGKELKFYDLVDVIDQKWPQDNNFVIYKGDSLSTPAQGSGATQRIGRRFTTKSVNVKATIQMGASADNVQALRTCIVKIFLVQDKQTNKAILTDAGEVFAGGNGTPPMINLENSDRFRILKSHKITFEPNETSPLLPNGASGYEAWSGPPERCVEMYWKGHINTLCDPASTNAGSGSTMDNSIYLIMWTNRKAGNAADSNQPLYRAYTRTRFCC